MHMHMYIVCCALQTQYGVEMTHENPWVGSLQASLQTLLTALLPHEQQESSSQYNTHHCSASLKFSCACRSGQELASWAR